MKSIVKEKALVFEASRDENSLAGKVILVTGGAQGLGRAICEVLQREGAHAVSADIREEAALQMDVGNEADIDRALSAMDERYGRLDAVINNAGIDVTLSIEDMPLSDWDRIVSVNLRGPFVLMKKAFPLLKRRGGGHIINIVSTASKRAWANASAYHATKWGLLGLSHAIHVEGRPHNIKVTALVSGGMRTPFLLDRFPDIDVATLQDPRNVAKTVAFLLTQPADTVIPEVMVLPMRETSWP